MYFPPMPKAREKNVHFNNPVPSPSSPAYGRIEYSDRNLHTPPKKNDIKVCEIYPNPKNLISHGATYLELEEFRQNTSGLGFFKQAQHSDSGIKDSILLLDGNVEFHRIGFKHSQPSQVLMLHWNYIRCFKGHALKVPVATKYLVPVLLWLKRDFIAFGEYDLEARTGKKLAPAPVRNLLDQILIMSLDENIQRKPMTTLNGVFLAAYKLKVTVFCEQIIRYLSELMGYEFQSLERAMNSRARRHRKKFLPDKMPITDEMFDELIKRSGEENYSRGIYRMIREESDMRPIPPHSTVAESRSSIFRCLWSLFCIFFGASREDPDSELIVEPIDFHRIKQLVFISAARRASASKDILPRSADRKDREECLQTLEKLKRESKSSPEEMQKAKIRIPRVEKGSYYYYYTRPLPSIMINSGAEETKRTKRTKRKL